jgi:hypothetical protein
MPAMHARRKDEYTAAQLIDALRHLHMTPEDLKSLVQLTQDFIGEELERRVNVMKQSRDGAGLPIEILRREITRLDPCMCKAALRLCEQN